MLFRIIIFSLFFILISLFKNVLVFWGVNAKMKHKNRNEQEKLHGIYVCIYAITIYQANSSDFLNALWSWQETSQIIYMNWSEWINIDILIQLWLMIKWRNDIALRCFILGLKMLDDAIIFRLTSIGTIRHKIVTFV